MKYLIYNSHSAFDRQLINQSKDYLLIDWFKEKSKREEYLSSGFPNPSNFPSIIDTETKQIVMVETTLEKSEKELSKLIEIKNTKSKDLYKLKRKAAYENQGLTVEAWIIALIQKEIDEDSTEWDNLVKKRNDIKLNIKKDNK